MTTRQRRFLSGKRQNTLSPKGIIKSSLLSKGVEEEIEDRDNNFLLFFFVLCVSNTRVHTRQKEGDFDGEEEERKKIKKKDRQKRGKRQKKRSRLE